MRQYYLKSGLIHLSFILLLIWSPWAQRTPPVLWLDGFDIYGGGGGGDGEELGKGGPKEETMGQEVPQPVQQAVPEKPAPVQEETVKKEEYKVDDAKVKPKEPVKKKQPVAPAKIADKTQKKKTNVVRVGKKKGAKAGDGQFDYGKGVGRGRGKGPGIGIGIGPGSGPGSGFGFGGYVGLLRQRIWSEWNEVKLFGSGKECVIGLTVMKSGQVRNIKIEKGSGDPFYDNLARRAVRNSSPLPKLPDAFPANEQRFRIKFVITD